MSCVHGKLWGFTHKYFLVLIYITHQEGLLLTNTALAYIELLGSFCGTFRSLVHVTVLNFIAAELWTIITQVYLVVIYIYHQEGAIICSPCTGLHSLTQDDDARVSASVHSSSLGWSTRALGCLSSSSPVALKRGSHEVLGRCSLSAALTLPFFTTLIFPSLLIQKWKCKYAGWYGRYHDEIGVGCQDGRWDEETTVASYWHIQLDLLRFISRSWASISI